VARYNVLDCRYMLRWFLDQEKEFDADASGDLRRANDLFHEALPVMAKCKIRGIPIDFAVLDELGSEVEAEQKKQQVAMQAPCLWEYRRKYGHRWEPGSNQKQQRLFYGVLGLEPLKLTPKGRDSDNPLHCSTDAESLHYLIDQTEPDSDERALLRLCLRGAKLTKMGGCIDNLRRLADSEGRVHPSFHLHPVTSYRSSSSDPNFQNIPIHNPELARIRRAFVPRLDWLMELDFSGNEVRGLACDSQDSRLIKNIKNDVDYHRYYAALLYEMDSDEISQGQRYEGKNQFVFPEFYGSYWKTIARGNSQWRAERIEEVEEIFWQDHAGVKRWQERSRDFYERNGYVQLLTGFRVRWGKHGPLSFNQTCNIPIQGIAFHRLLAVMIKAEAEMVRRGLQSMIVGQIHDSIVSDVADDEREEVADLQRDIARASQWEWDRLVPWDVEIKIGRNLLDMEAI